MKITIDGPAGSGKSTIAKILADKLGFFYIDSGALYRTFAWALQKFNIKNENIDEFTRNFQVDYKWHKKKAKLSVDGRDVSEEIRTQEISNQASAVAKIASVRNLITDLQRQIATQNNVVLEGRDAGTIVFPEAEKKFFLTASIDERTRRRKLELENKGEKVDFKKLKQEIIERDLKDSTREIAPLVKAKDAVEIDTDGKTIDEVVQILLAMTDLR